jgi:hypothetical protein
MATLSHMHHGVLMLMYCMFVYMCVCGVCVDLSAFQAQKSIYGPADFTSSGSQNSPLCLGRTETSLLLDNDTLGGLMSFFSVSDSVCCMFCWVGVSDLVSSRVGVSDVVSSRFCILCSPWASAVFARPPLEPPPFNALPPPPLPLIGDIKVVGGIATAYKASSGLLFVPFGAVNVPVLGLLCSG